MNDLLDGPDGERLEELLFKSRTKRELNKSDLDKFLFINTEDLLILNKYNNSISINDKPEDFEKKILYIGIFEKYKKNNLLYKKIY